MNYAAALNQFNADSRMRIKWRICLFIFC